MLKSSGPNIETCGTRENTPFSVLTRFHFLFKKICPT